MIAISYEISKYVLYIYQQKVESTTSSGDLMADLHKKLAMRRKGISGAKGNDPNAGDSESSKIPQSSSLLGSISSMIPAPPKPDTNTDHSDNESDWE